jgi:hypothetical protein
MPADSVADTISDKGELGRLAALIARYFIRFPLVSAIADPGS